jgi:hypothetical protein
MANPYTDQRAIMARLGAISSQSAGAASGLNPVGPGKSENAIKLGRAAANLSIQNPELRARIEGIASGAGSKPGGIAGAVFGNPVVQAITKPLSLLAVPQKMVISTLREGADLLDSNPDTKASFGDWTKQVKDPTFGFGKAFKIDTGNIWLDRAIGFTGDVLLDPITYATFGAGKFAGYSGRLELATRVLENTGDNVLAKAVAIEGRSALIGKADILERVGANQSGVYMFGKRLKVGVNGQGWRIPMTGHIGEIGEQTLSKLRLAASDTRFGQYMQKITMPKDLLNARIALARGVATPEVAADTLKILSSRPAERAMVATTKTALAHEVMGIVKEQETLGILESTRSTIHKFIENPALIDTASDAEKQALEHWKNFYMSKRTLVDDAWKMVDPAADVKWVEDFFPRTMSDEAKAFLNGTGEHAQQLRDIMMEDPFALPGSFTPRSLREGKAFFGKTLAKEDLNIESLNKIANEAGFEGEFFVTDAVEAAKRYTSDVADEMGRIHRAQILTDNGFYKKLDEQRVLTNSVDTEDVARARIHVEERRAALNGALDEHRLAAQSMLDTLRTEADNVARSGSSAADAVSRLEQFTVGIREKIMGIADNIQAEKERFMYLFGHPADIAEYGLSDTFPDMLKPVLAEYDAMQKEIRYFDEVISGVRGQLMVEQGSQAFMSDTMHVLEGKVKESMDKLQLANESIQSAIEVSNIINNTWETVVRGGRIDAGAAHDLLVSMRTILGTRDSTTLVAQARKQAKVMGISGNLRAFIDGPEFKKILEDVSHSSEVKISKESVRSMKPDSFVEGMNKILTEDMSLHAIREHATYAIARDMHIYQGQLPDALQTFYDDLLSKMKDAGEAEAFIKSQARSKSRTTLDDFESRWNAPFQESSTRLDEINSYRALLDVADEGGTLHTAFNNLIKAGHVSQSTGDVAGYASTAFQESHVRALEIAVSEATQGKVKDLTFLYDYIDDPMFEGATVSDVLNHTRLRLNQAEADFTTPKYEMYTGKLKKGQAPAEADFMSQEEILKQYDSARQRAGGRAGPNAPMDAKGSSSISPRLARIAADPEGAKLELANSLMRYAAISDAVVKFESISALLAAHGHVVTEDMYRGILTSTHGTYGVQFQTKMDQLVRAEEVFAEMRSKFNIEMDVARRSAKTTGEGRSPSSIFEETLRHVLSGPDAEIIKQVIGPSMYKMTDPLTMRNKVIELGRLANDTTLLTDARVAAKAQYEAYLNDFVIPWAKSMDPTMRSSPKNAIDMLKSRVGRGQSVATVAEHAGPLHPLASERHVQKWFDELFDKPIQRTRYVEKEFRGEIVMAPEYYDEVVPGNLSKMYTAYSKHNSFFMQMKDGYLNPAEFLANPNIVQGTPSSYGIMMSNHASRLEKSLTSGLLAEDSEFAGMAITQARGKARTAANKAESMAVGEEAKLAKLDAVHSAYSNPNLTSEELANLGFTKKMLQQRDEVIAYNAYMSSGEHAKAEADKRIVDFLHTTAHMDFSKFDEGIVIGSRQVPVYADTAEAAHVIKKTSAVEQKQAVIDSIKRDMKMEQDAIDRKYLVDKPDGSGRAYRNREAATAHQREVRNWKERNLPTWKQRMSTAQEELRKSQIEGPIVQTGGETVDNAGRVILEYKTEPVFATMPDGSPIKFSKAEWDSLYAKQLAPLEIKNLRGQSRALESSIGILEGEKDKILRSGRTYTYSVRKKIEAIDEKIVFYKSAQSQIEAKILASTSDTRNAALEKIRVLMNGHEGQPVGPVERFGGDSMGGWANTHTSYDKTYRGVNKVIADVRTTADTVERNAMLQGEYTVANNPTVEYYIKRDSARLNLENASKEVKRGRYEFTTYSASGQPIVKEGLSPKEIPHVQLKPGHYVVGEDVGLRRNGLQANWLSTKESATLRKGAEMAKEANIKEYLKDMPKTRRLGAKAARDARAIATNATAEADAIHEAVRQSVMQMRSAERRAVEAAGGKIETTAAGMSYQLNGKTYQIPSLDEMMANPKKYINEYSKRGAIFYDLKKSGNVTMLSDMGHQQRAVATVAALHNMMTTNDLTGVARLELLNSGARVTELQGVLASWSENASKLRESMNMVHDALRVERETVQRGIEASNVEMTAARLDLFELGEELKATYGADFNPEATLNHYNNVVSTLNKRATLFEQIVGDMPKKGFASNWIKAKRPDVVARYNREFSQWLFQNNEVLNMLVNSGGDESNRAIASAFARAHMAEGRFLTEQMNVRQAERALEVASTPRVVEKVIKPFEDGFEEAAQQLMKDQGLTSVKNMHLPSYAVNKDSMAIIDNISRIKDGAMAREVGRFVGQYTGFFKAYATLTPGFHVRNAISNTFQMFAAGAEVKNMFEGMRLYKSLGHHLQNGKSIEEWLIAEVPSHLRMQARIAADTTMALGGGNVDDAFREFLSLKKNVLTDNFAIRASRSTGHHVEGSARFTLAFDTAMNGGDFNASFNRTKKFLFDYNDPTILDDTVRNIIPFWTWMSRNLPLQLTNQWHNPKPYMIYKHFADNFGAGVGDMPGYMKDQGAFNVGGNNFLAPDMPHIKMQQQIQEFQDPRKLLSYLNPAIRVPMELAGNRQFFNNAQFGDKYSKPGSRYLAFQPLLEALGQVKHNSKGEAVISEKGKYAVDSLLPSLGQAERMFPSAGGSADGMAWARYLGVPIRNVNNKMMDSEYYNRMQQLQKLQIQQKNINGA